jgi:phosphoribosylpyrophosphate synthetase
MNSSTVSKLRGAKIIYFAYFSFNESEVTSIMDQMLFLNSLNHYGVFEINVVLPYFPLGTMERIVGEGEIPTGYALANMLNSIPSGASKNNIYIFDIHALCSRFFFHTNSIPVLITLMPDYLSHITTTYPDATNLNFIVFPDDGAKKRFEKLIPSTFNKIVCNKTRVGNDRFIKIESGMDNLTEGTPLRLKTGKQINMFIVDDLVQSGGTLTETVSGIIQFLQKECPGDTNISAIKFNTLVTHSVYPTNANLVNFFSEPKKINKLITSNSRPVRSNYIEKTFRDKVSVIDIGSVLHKIFTNTENFTEYIAPYSIN